MKTTAITLRTFDATPANVLLDESHPDEIADPKPMRLVFIVNAPEILPVKGDVREGVAYGENGTEFVGTYAPGGGGSGMSKSRVVNDA